MPRYFEPIQGFADTNIQSIKVETIDGHPQSSEVLKDGTENPIGARNQLSSAWIPTWTEEELQKLVADGKWHEIQPEAAVAPDAVVVKHDEPRRGRRAESPVISESVDSGT